MFQNTYYLNMTDTCNITIIATGIEEKAKQTFKSGYIMPTSLQGKPNLGTMPSSGLGNFAVSGAKSGAAAPGHAGASQQLKTIGGINKAPDIKSSVEEKSLKIPDFLRSK